MKFLYKKTTYIYLIVLMLIPAFAYSIQVSFFIGDVKLYRQGKKASVSIGDIVKNGDILKTGSGSFVEITYKDGSKIRLKDKTTAKIGSKSIRGSNNISLIRGSLIGKFGKLVKGSRKVYSPTIVCAIRGTEFKMAVSKNGNSRVDLSEGKLKISNPYGTVNIKEGQNTSAKVSKGPDNDPEGSLDQWQEMEDTEFEKNPQKDGESYAEYMNRFKENAKESGKSVVQYRNRVKGLKNKDKLVKAGVEISNASEKIEDDIILNETANSAVDTILSNFKDTESKLYQTFLKVKRESNYVLQQQQQNYKAIAAVKEAYKQAYKNIMGTYHKDFNKIMEDTNFQQVLPKIDGF